MRSNKIIIIVFLLLLCIFNSCNINDTPNENKNLNESIIGAWYEETTNRIFVITTITIQIFNTDENPYNEGFYTNEKNILKIEYTRYHGLLIGNELIETFEYILNDQYLELTQIDEEGNKAVPIKLIKKQIGEI